MTGVPGVTTREQAERLTRRSMRASSNGLFVEALRDEAREAAGHSPSANSSLAAAMAVTAMTFAAMYADLLRKYEAATSHKGRKAAEIAADICSAHGFTIQAIRARCRDEAALAARREIIYRVWSETEMSLGEIGRLVNRDQSTIRHALAVSVRAHGQAARPFNPKKRIRQPAWTAAERRVAIAYSERRVSLEGALRSLPGRTAKALQIFRQRHILDMEARP